MKKTKKITGKTISISATKFLYKNNKREIDRNIQRVLKSGWYILGKENEELEKKLADYLGAHDVVTVASGTDALTLAVKSLELKKDDEVVLPANVYPTVFGVALSGVKIKLADVDPTNLNISLENIKKVVTEKTKLIIVVHLYGNPVEISPIKKFAKKRGIYLIEDCAQAIGAKYKDLRVGVFGDLGTFSFYPTKNLAAFGDGGAISINNSRFKKKIKLLKMYGEEKKYESMLLGHNSRFDEIQAAIIMAQMRTIDRQNKKRREIARIYRKNLQGLPLSLLKETPKSESVFHLFPIFLEERDSLGEFLSKKGIETGIHYPHPIHLTKTFSYLGYELGDFPISESASKQMLTIPIHPFLARKDVEYICKCIKDFFKKSSKL